MVTGGGRKSGDSRESASNTTVIASGAVSSAPAYQRISTRHFSNRAASSRKPTRPLTSPANTRPATGGPDEQRRHRETEQRIVLPTGPGEEPPTADQERAAPRDCERQNEVRTGRMSPHKIPKGRRYGHRTPHADLRDAGQWSATKLARTRNLVHQLDLVRDLSGKRLPILT